MEHPQEVQTADSFDLDAGELCLDFANTLDWHASSRPIEMLNRYGDLLAWGRAAGLLNETEEEALLRTADQRPEAAGRVLEEARELREAIYRIFVAVSQGQAAAAQDLDILTDFWQRAVRSMRIVLDQGEYRLGWDFSGIDLGRVLWPVVDSAVRLLESEQRERVGQCQDDRGCGYLFLDTSRNRSRRWCSMDSCGNRAKAHRHYSRKKQ